MLHIVHLPKRTLPGPTPTTKRPLMEPENDDTRREGVRSLDVCAVVEVYDDTPAQCTMYPNTESCQDEQLSAWITATGKAFVDRNEMR